MTASSTKVNWSKRSVAGATVFAVRTTAAFSDAATREMRKQMALVRPLPRDLRFTMMEESAGMLPTKASSEEVCDEGTMGDIEQECKGYADLRRGVS